MSAPDNAPLTILVVDDDVDYRRVVAAQLRGTLASTALMEIDGPRTLFEALEVGIPQVAIVALHLAFGDGLGVARLIRSRHPECAVLVVGPRCPEEVRTVLAAECVDEVLGRSTRGLASLPERVRALAERPRPRPTADPVADGASWRQSAASLAHDLQDPVQLMQHSAAALAEVAAVRDDPAAERHTARILSNARRIGELLDRFVADASALARDVTISGTASLRAIAERVAAASSPRIESLGATIDIGDLPEVRGDPVQVRRVFENLIGNALKFHGDAPPYVVVRAVRQPGGWLLTVADNGVGVAEADAERAFDTFTRVSPDRDVAGSGIGLATCRDIVRAHGGAIWLSSPPAGGTIVYIHWPDHDGSVEERPE